jgi:prepilin-type N-terminal cleavage/methylation domain-containing protein
MKNKKGLTIIELVIVIIILVLLAVIAVWSTSNIIKKAEASSVYGEFKAVYAGAVQLQNFYNAGTIEEYEIGEDYCKKIEDEDGTWFVIYGLNHMVDKMASGDRYSENVIKKWGLDELKRSYQVLFGDNIVVKYLDGEYTLVGGYKVTSYDDILALLESGAV